MPLAWPKCTSDSELRSVFSCGPWLGLRGDEPHGTVSSRSPQYGVWPAGCSGLRSIRSCPARFIGLSQVTHLAVGGLSIALGSPLAAVAVRVGTPRLSPCL